MEQQDETEHGAASRAFKEGEAPSGGEEQIVTLTAGMAQLPAPSAAASGAVGEDGSSAAMDATQRLRTAMEKRDVAGLRAAIVAAEGEAEVDVAVVEVSVGKRCMGSAIRVQHLSVAPNTTQHYRCRPAPPAHHI